MFTFDQCMHLEPKARLHAEHEGDGTRGPRSFAQNGTTEPSLVLRAPLPSTQGSASAAILRSPDNSRSLGSDRRQVQLYLRNFVKSLQCV